MTPTGGLDTAPGAFEPPGDSKLARIQELDAEASTLRRESSAAKDEVVGLHKAIAVMSQLAVELDIHSAMTSVRHVALELLDCERVTMFLIIDGKDELRGECGMPEEGIIRINYGEGIAGTVAKTGQLLNIPDAYQSPLFNPEVDRRTGFRTRNILCCAVSDITGKSVAVLQALNKRGNARGFTLHDELNLRLFGVHLGNTLAKSRLHEMVQREKERLATLSRCFKRLNATTSLTQVISSIVAAVEELLNARDVVVLLMDQARRELWNCPTDGSPATTCRIKQGRHVAGRVALGQAQRCVRLDELMPDDPLLQLMASRPSCESGGGHELLLQPVVDMQGDKCLAVVCVLNKVERRVKQDYFFEECFTDSDCNAMSLFAMEVAEILAHRSLEVSFASALSIVSANGSNANNVQLSNALKAQLMEYYVAKPYQLGTLPDVNAIRTLGALSSIGTPRKSINLEPPGAVAPEAVRPEPLSAGVVLRRERTQERHVAISLGSEAQLRRWDADFTSLSTPELVKLAFDIFRLSGVPHDLGISDSTLTSFVAAVASHYHDHPYHNFSHVCHVLHSVWLMVETTQLKQVLSPAEELGLLVSAICHDIDHDGHTNSYHVRLGTELAKRYNDVSVMENHHCALTFAILSRKDCNILAGFHGEAYCEMRKLIITSLLATDISHHFSLTDDLQKRGAESLAQPEDATARQLLCKVVLHAADISNMVRPFHIAKMWSDRVHMEFKKQAAEERALGLPVAAHMDAHDDPTRCKMELNFIDYIVMPLWDLLANGFPALQSCVVRLKDNRRRFAAMASSSNLAELMAQSKAVAAAAAADAQHQQAAEPSAPAVSSSGIAAGEQPRKRAAAGLEDPGSSAAASLVVKMPRSQD